MTKDLIVIGEDWGGLPSSTQHLIKCLRHERKVLWVNSIGLRQPRINLRDLTRALSKIIRAFLPFSAPVSQAKLNKEESGNFSIVSPLTIPAPKSKLARYLAKSLLAFQISRLAKKMGMDSPVLWISLPTAVDLIGSLSESKVIYYCCDDFSSLDGVDHETVSSREAELSVLADLIVVSSDTLYKKFSKHKAVRRKTNYLPHGVDYELFSCDTRRAIDLPKTDKPIAGFYGSIAEWFDTDLVYFLATSLPDWEFVFIGHVDIDVYKLEQLPNVNFIGPKRHDDLPQYSQHWDVSLLPFKLNGQIEACNPLKLREYLAAGSPIISTKFPALEQYSDVVNVASTKAEFLKLMELSQNVEKKAVARKSRALVQGESWKAKANEVEIWMLQQ